MPSVAILTGEASGDRVGGQLAHALRTLNPNITLWGTGGSYLREAGVEVVVETSKFGMVGVAQAVKTLPQILAARNALLLELKKRKPDVLVAVDAGALHLGFGPIEGVCFWARRELPNTKILYYFPPGSWRRTLKGTSLNNVTDCVATPFSWSETELKKFGVNAHFVGHPLLDLVKPSQTTESFFDQYGLDPEHPTVGILPGSRVQEIKTILPILIEAAYQISTRVPSVQFTLALAPTINREVIEKYLQDAEQRHSVAANTPNTSEKSDKSGKKIVPATGSRHDLEEFERRQQQWQQKLQGGKSIDSETGPLPIVIVEDKTYDVMAHSDILLTVSGTATLEAAILQKPMVITYKLASENWLEYQLIKKKLPQYVGMPNILAGKGICPEYLQENATPKNIAEEAIGLLLEPDRLLTMRENLQEMRTHLGEPGGAARTAQMVLDLLP
jgi:lipid-A-disaccharide synthase